MPSVNKIIQDKMIGHQVGLLRLSSGITNKLVALLNKTEDDLLRQLALKDNVRTNVLLKDVREVLNAAKSGEYNMLQKELTDLAHYEPKYVEQIIKGAMPMKFNMTMPSTDMLSSIVTSKPFEGKLLKEWVDELSESRRRGIRDAVRMGMVEGQSIDQIARRIRGTRALGYKDGLMETSRRGAQAMVRTAVNHTATNARELTYVKNQDLISEVQWISTLDARTTPICQARDGMTFPVNSGPRPPAHINCRSTTAPVVKSFRELGFDLDEAPPGTRASMDGQVPEKTTYNDWLKGQPKAMQDSILGPSRAEMFREGYSVDKFVDLGSGKHFTLKELGAMDGVGVPDKPFRFINRDNVSDRFVNAMEDAWDRMPPGIRSTMAAEDRGYLFGDWMTEIFPSFKGQKPRGWPEGSTWDNVPGVSMGKRVGIAENHIHWKGQQKITASIAEKDRRLFYHETGHIIDDVGYQNPKTKGMVWSDTPEFKEAYRLDVLDLEYKDTETLSYFLQEGAAGRQEIFAEIFATELNESLSYSALENAEIPSAVFNRIRLMVRRIIKEMEE